MALKVGGYISISLLELFCWMWSRWRPKPLQMDKKLHWATYDLKVRLSADNLFSPVLLWKNSCFLF